MSIKKVMAQAGVMVSGIVIISILFISVVFILSPFLEDMQSYPVIIYLGVGSVVLTWLVVEWMAWSYSYLKKEQALNDNDVKKGE